MSTSLGTSIDAFVVFVFSIKEPENISNNRYRNYLCCKALTLWSLRGSAALVVFTNHKELNCIAEFFVVRKRSFE